MLKLKCFNNKFYKASDLTVYYFFVFVRMETKTFSSFWTHVIYKIHNGKYITQSIPNYLITVTYTVRVKQ